MNNHRPLDIIRNSGFSCLCRARHKHESWPDLVLTRFCRPCDLNPTYTHSLSTSHPTPIHPRTSWYGNDIFLVGLALGEWACALTFPVISSFDEEVVHDGLGGGVFFAGAGLLTPPAVDPTCDFSCVGSSAGRVSARYALSLVGVWCAHGSSRSKLSQIAPLPR